MIVFIHILVKRTVIKLVHTVYQRTLVIVVNGNCLAYFWEQIENEALMRSKFTRRKLVDKIVSADFIGSCSRYLVWHLLLP